MIPVKELRIGNIVLHNNETIVIGVIARGHVGLENLSGENSGFLNYEDIAPVPLTPELLEACGFYYKDGAAEYGEERKNGVHLYAHDEEPGYYHFSLGVFNGTRTEIKHFHQLQNLYFALTNSELDVKQLTI